MLVLFDSHFVLRYIGGKSQYDLNNALHISPFLQKNARGLYKSMGIIKKWRAPSAHNDAIKGDTHTHTRKIIKFLATIGINTICQPVTLPKDTLPNIYKER